MANPALYGKRNLRVIDEAVGTRRLNKRGEEKAGKLLLAPDKGVSKVDNPVSY